MTVTPPQLADIFIRLEAEGAHNVNLVTPTHFVPGICSAIDTARSRGLSVPIVYNTGSYDTLDTIRMLEGMVNVYLPDLKYYRTETAKELSLASAYPAVARAAIAEMVRQQPFPLIEDGIMKRGVIVRILLLPGHLAEAKLNVKYLHDAYGDSIYISLMSQYTPPPDTPAPLSRRVSRAEYEELVGYASHIGVRYAFTQNMTSAKESYIPDFNLGGTI